MMTECQKQFEYPNEFLLQSIMELDGGYVSFRAESI